MMRLGVGLGLSVVRRGANQAIPGSPIPTVDPVISGTAKEGQILTVTNGTWTNAPTGYTYQWRRNGQAIALNATAQTYTLVAADVGFMITCTVTATNAISSNYANASGVGPIASNVAAPFNTVAPAVTGTTTQGQTLAVSDGTWNNSPTGFAYQWKRDGAAISGATANTYLLTATDVGTTITCDVTASNAGGPTTATSNGVGPIAAAAVPVPTVSTAPVISGTATQGQTLTTTNGTWSNSPTGFTYQWKRSGSAISGATAQTYALVLADVGANITCDVVASNAGGSSAPSTSNSLGPVASSGVTPFFDDFNRADENLEASANYTKISGATVGAAKVVSNNLAATTTVENAYLTPDKGANNQFVEYKNNGNGSAGPFVCARMTDMNNWVGIRSSTTAYQTYKRLAGALTQVNTFTGVPAVGDIVRLEINNDIASTFLNGAANGTSGNVSDIPASTRQGINVRSQTRTPSWIENLSAGAL